MKITGLSEYNAKCVVSLVSLERYNGNIVVRNSRRLSLNRCTISIRTLDSRAYGSRTASSGRYTPAVSWEGFRDVIRAMFDAGATRIVTSYANYTKDNFEDTYNSISYPAGSMMYRCDLRDLTI